MRLSALTSAAVVRADLAAVHVGLAPTGVGYSILLLLHVASAVIGFGALVVTGVQARRAMRGPSQSGADGLRRYFRPGVNWAGRALYGVPVLGFALIADSGGAYDAGQQFVVAGLVLWLVSAVVAEAVVWPGERRVQLAVTGGWGDPATQALVERE
ncbi:MAG: hypothetical protein ACYDB3_06980 [Acidimicrobiales bacterium]